jgi:hypothetical protein
VDCLVYYLVTCELTTSVVLMAHLIYLDSIILTDHTFEIYCQCPVLNIEMWLLCICYGLAKVAHRN